MTTSTADAHPASADAAPAGHVRLIASYAMRFGLRTGGGVMFLLLTVIGGLLVSNAVLAPVEALLESPEIREAMQGDVGKSADYALRTDEVRDGVRKFTGSDEKFAHSLLEEHPSVLSAIFVVLLLLQPFLVCFGAFNQTAGDIGNRGLRYLLLRTGRGSVFLGRFVGAFLFCAVTTAALVAMVTVYIGLKLHFYPAGALVGWAAQGTLALVVLALPYVAFCAWISALTDSAAVALVLSLVASAGPILVLSQAETMIQGDQGWLSRLWPWGWKYDLLHPDALTRTYAYAAMLGFAAAFLFLGLRHFRRRDV